MHGARMALYYSFTMILTLRMALTARPVRTARSGWTVVAAALLIP